MRGWKRNTEKQARRCAEACLARMKYPERWTIQVHENLGWHWRLEADGISLYPTSLDGRYHAMPRPSYTFWCCAGGEGYSKDPNKAVDLALAEMSKTMVELNTVWELAKQCQQLGDLLCSAATRSCRNRGCLHSRPHKRRIDPQQDCVGARCNFKNKACDCVPVKSI